MLPLKYLFENYDLAREALKNWEHDEDTLDRMLAQFRISSNAIYPFCQNGGVCFLRLAPLEEKLEKNVRGEMEFIQYLLDRGYPALRPVPAKTGEVCLVLNTRWGRYYAAAFHRVGGVPLEDTDLEMAEEYGRALGRLHSLASQFAPETKKWTHAEALDWTASVLSEYRAPDFAAAECAALKRELSALPAGPECYGLVHYDFELDNVFYDRERNACSVIDFEDGMYHWYALDVEQVFDSLEEELSGEALETAKSKFIKGYREEHGYTREMDASRPLMRRFIDLYGYARLIRCVAEKFPDEPAWMVELRGKLEKAISAKEAGMLRVHRSGPAQAD